MNASRTLSRIAFPLLVAFGILYLFGIRSGIASVALLTISAVLLYLVTTSMLGGVRDIQDALDASERTFSFAGWNFRVFTDEQGAIWLRAADLKRFLDYKQSDYWLARRFPARYGKVHAQIDAWYMHFDALQCLMGKSGNDSVQRFLAWLKREVIGMQRFEQRMSRPGQAARQKKPISRHNVVFTWFLRHWRGETGLMAAIFGGGAIVTVSNLLVHLLKEPVDITLNYQLSALIYVAQIAVVGGGMYWWGRGVLHSTQRWIAADRSLLIALSTAVLGFGGVFYGLGQIVDTDKQYFLTDFFTILLDADHKPEVSYDADTKLIVLDGELGFGTTNRVRQILIDHPDAQGIELKSYGGRAAEGFGLFSLIVDHKMETYVRAECMSACVYAYVGGWQRHVANSAKFGLHRSGYTWQAGGDDLNETDHVFSSVMGVLGVDEDFIARGLKPSIHDIYEPTPDEVLKAGLATTEWI